MFNPFWFLTLYYFRTKQFPLPREGGLLRGPGAVRQILRVPGRRGPGAAVPRRSRLRPLLPEKAPTPLRPLLQCRLR